MSLPLWVQIAVAFSAAVGGIGGIVALAKVLPESRKLDAEAAKSGADAASILSSAAVALLEPAQAEVARLTAKVKVLEDRVDALTSRLRLANRLLTEAGIPFPPIED